MKLLEYYQESQAIKVVEDESTGLFVARYVHLNVDWDDERNLMARGIVLDKDSNIISRGYNKFFNYLELLNREDISNKELSDWDKGEIVVTEKIDGSMMLVGWYNGDYLISSSSSITNDYTLMFRKMIRNWYRPDVLTMLDGDEGGLLEKYSIVLEYMSPETQIVIPSDKPSITLHGIVEKKTGKVISRMSRLYIALAKLLGANPPKVLNMTKDELLYSQKHDEGIEGYVIEFVDTGKLLKIKTDWYIEQSMEVKFLFGNKVYTKNNINLAWQWLETGEIDDYIAIANQRNRVEFSYFLQNALKIRTKLHQVEKIVDSLVNSMDKRSYIREYGTKTYETHLVLAKFNGKKNLYDKALKNMFVEEMKEIYVDKN